MTAFVGPLGDEFTPESVEIDYQLSGQWNDTASNVPVFLDDGSEWDTLTGRATLRLTPTELQSLYAIVRSGQPLTLKGKSYALGPDLDLSPYNSQPLGTVGSVTVDAVTYPTIIMPDTREWTTADLIHTFASFGGVWISSALRTTVVDQVSAVLTDGWRVATHADYQSMMLAIPGASLGINDNVYDAGKHLRSTTGWSDPGLDTYGFHANSLDVNYGYIWSSDPSEPIGIQIPRRDYNPVSPLVAGIIPTYANIRLVRDQVGDGPGVPVNVTGWAIDGPADATASLYDVTLDYRYSTLPAPTGGDLAYLMTHGEAYPTLEMDGQFVSKDVGESWSSSPCERAELKWYCRGLTTDQAAKIIRGLRALRGDWYTWTIPSGMVPFGYPTNATVKIKIPEFQISKTGTMLWEIECRFVADGYSLAILAGYGLRYGLRYGTL